jgi:menaquinone-dependent protoporphyrinogen oxidase
LRVLVAYASKHGATKAIAERIGESLHSAGVSITIQDVSADPTPGEYDAVVIGSAVYMGNWRKVVMEYVERHEDALKQRPVWLFSSGPLGDEVVDEAKWTPRGVPELQQRIGAREHKIFKGALQRERLGRLERMVVRLVRAPQGDYRDWDEIEAWALAVGEQLLTT